ncbi:A disintegrin and metalloproteinase with thrombospondin motifs 12-like isoform X2 [Solenopsis invicta]|uniref:A disintegrin and metalloproteinase with thrombospondin motifs 12-like isoform X2 n=1 Tax=Solenopsis invicta TaxID=13686 RepID=UPI00193D5351|nr:A disintegrin and metalloproteinase with thrombospondin motifs 12-like isoform X2 [Solenopsis invicta]XP_039302000.1 A disintegrin and metalloproteinase with thrombospondin motifs 12-like isoform X2 [Solenopsis invicta]
MHFRRYTRAADLSDEHKIVIPRRVRSDGSFISHQIPHHFERSFYRNRTTGDDAVHYRLRIDHEEHHVELYPNRRLLGPDAIVERRWGSKNFLNNMQLKRLQDTQCHYRARVRNQSEESALSTCYGLVGYIKTKHAWYMIEPVAGHDFTKEIEQPHIVYKRSPDEYQDNDVHDALCNVIGETSRIIAKRALNPRNKMPAGSIENKSYTLELLVVLDKSLLDYHKEFDVENYILTLFNMAAGLFHDVSLGIHMQLTIVRIIRLEVEENEVKYAVKTFRLLK